MSTLFEMTKINPRLAASFLEQLNISKISLKSSTAESTSKKEKQIDSTKLAFETVNGIKDSDTRTGIEVHEQD